MKWWMVLVDRLPKLVLPWRTLFPSGQFVRWPQLQGILIITICIITSSPYYTNIHHHHFSSRTAQCSSCRSKPDGNRFTACLGIFPTPWIPEQEDWSMTKLLFRYCLLKGNPNASPPFKCNFSLRGFERPEDPFHFHLRRLCRDESNFLRGASSGRSNIVVVARTMNSSVSSYSGAKK